MDVFESGQRAGPRDAAMSGIEHADFGFLVRQHGIDEFHAGFLPCRPSGNELILDDPLREGFAHNWATVVETRGGENPLAGVGRGVIRSTIALGVAVLASTHCLSSDRLRYARNSKNPVRNFSPLWRRLSQHCSVTGPASAWRR